MKREDHRQGPSRGLVENIRRFFAVLTGMLHTRLELVVTELEEEKNNITGLLLMAGLTLMFIIFGVISLLFFILLSAAPEYRLMILGCASAVFIVLAFVFGIIIRGRIARGGMLQETRRQLKKDLDMLKEDER